MGSGDFSQLLSGDISQVLSKDELDDVPTEQYNEAIESLRKSHLLKKRQLKALKLARMAERRNEH